MKALIDGDIICYSCGFAAQKTVYYVQHLGARTTDFERKKDAEEWRKANQPAAMILERIEAEPVENALHSAKLLVQRCVEKSGSDNYEIYLTGDSNFRDNLVTYYKGNRDRSKKPIHYQAIKDYLLKHHKAIIVEGQEADDAMAQEQWLDIQMTDGDKYLTSTTICTIDKDLDMIPGWHYNWRKDKLYWRDFATAIVFFYTQLLTGDATDNIKGVPGIGIKRAAKLLMGATSELQLYRRVQTAYMDYVTHSKSPLPVPANFTGGNNLAFANALLKENADLLWIRRVEGEEWQPPTERNNDD